MKPVRYDYEAEEYDLDNVYNEDDDRRSDPRSTSATANYGTWADEAGVPTQWYD